MHTNICIEFIKSLLNHKIHFEITKITIFGTVSWGKTGIFIESNLYYVIKM